MPAKKLRELVVVAVVTWQSELLDLAPKFNYLGYLLDLNFGRGHSF